jgi:type IV secretion system protein TrbB
MTTPALSQVPQQRRHTSLRLALGHHVGLALEDSAVVEILVNADGTLRLDTVGVGMIEVHSPLSVEEREAIIRLLASEAGETVTTDRPFLSTTLPGSAARVQAMIPPLVAAPILAIRKRPGVIYTLADYATQGIATAAQIKTLQASIADRRNIVVAGGTGSGKTTLLNALLAEPAFQQARLVILEDTTELHCAAPDTVQLLTKRTDPPVTMRDLVQMTLRLRPDRIIVGEVRDGAALEVLKAWNTGHPGGLLTLHANSAADALTRLEDLCLEAAHSAPQRLIASAVDLIVFIERTPDGRRITEVRDCRAASPTTEGRGIQP